MRITRRWLTVCFALMLGCESNLIDNPSFDRWCGAELCDWQTDSGKIERVGSWHDKDYAVSFVATGTQISQLSRATVPGSCIRFDMIADVEPRAELSLQVDFHDDGVIDVAQAVPAARWQDTSFLIHTPGSYTKVRYIFRKAGEGRALLAQVWADLEGGCTERAADE